MPRVEIFPSGEMDFTHVTVDNGKMSGEPVFYGTGRELVPIALLAVHDSSGNVVRRYSLRISGGELRLSLHERSNPVKPAYEVPAEQLKPPSAPKAVKNG
jgi:hypothetical protein